MPGVEIAIYIAGSKARSGEIVAFAMVDRVRTWRSNQAVDPSIYLTEVPDKVLELGSVEVLDGPVSFKSALPLLTIALPEGKNWGTLLQGGCRRLVEADWSTLRAFAGLAQDQPLPDSCGEGEVRE
ncbi:MAG: hypothetical protein ABIO70_14650 [Pseudomonadota bacterium]